MTITQTYTAVIKEGSAEGSSVKVGIPELLEAAKMLIQGEENAKLLPEVFFLATSGSDPDRNDPVQQAAYELLQAAVDSVIQQHAIPKPQNKPALVSTINKDVMRKAFEILERTDGLTDQVRQEITTAIVVARYGQEVIDLAKSIGTNVVPPRAFADMRAIDIMSEAKQAVGQIPAP